MSYLLAQILVCLLIAGLIGAIIGWLLRGGCSRRLRDCEDEWKMRMGSLENEYTSKVHESDVNITNNDSESHTLYNHPSKDYDSEHATLKRGATHSRSDDNHVTKAGLVGGVAAAGAGIASMANSAKDSVSDASSSAYDSAKGSIGDIKDGVTNSYESAKDSISSPNIDGVKSTLSKRNIYLEDDKISLYNENGVDFENSKDLENDYDISTLEGISEDHAKSLKGLGIHTTNNLVSKLRKDSHQITKVSRELNVKPEDVSSWVSMADIIKLPGVDAKTAKLMQNVGISSLSELSVTNPISLYNEMVVFNEKTNILQKEPSLSSITTWSKVAKHL